MYKIQLMSNSLQGYSNFKAAKNLTCGCHSYHQLASSVYEMVRQFGFDIFDLCTWGVCTVAMRRAKRVQPERHVSKELLFVAIILNGVGISHIFTTAWKHSGFFLF